MRVTWCGVRGAGCGLRVTGYEVRGARCEVRGERALRLQPASTIGLKTSLGSHVNINFAPLAPS